MDRIIPWLTTRTVIYPCLWSCLPAPSCAMLLGSGKRKKVFIRKLPSQCWTRTDLIAWTTSTTRMTVVRTNPVALQRVACCEPRLVFQTCIHSWWIPGTHYWRATNRGFIKTLLPQSSIRSNRWRIQSLRWSLEWKLRMLTMLYFLTIWPLKWCLSSQRSEALT